MNIFIKKYFIRVILLNLLGLGFLSDSISFDQGFFSLQGLIYSLNKYFLLLFILFETISVYLQEYQLNFDFLYLVFTNFFSLNFKYNYFILFEKYRYLIFFFSFLVYIFYFEKKLLKTKLNLNFNFFIYIGIIGSIIFFLQIERLNLYATKLKNYQDLILKYNILRNDNWFLQTVNYFYYEKNSNKNIYKTLNYEEVINKNSNNIFVIINESYPLFKNHQLNMDMMEILTNDKIKFEIIRKNWNKKYSTQGAEIEFFCNTDKDFRNFKSNFIKHLRDNNCWILNLAEKNKVFIHTYEKTFFNRGVYDFFFSKTYFLDDLKKLNYKMCPGMYNGICDYEILKNLKNFIVKDNNLFVFLTLQNHHPIKLYPIIEKKNLSKCKDLYPLNINEQFCYLYLNQSYFNKLIYENIIKTMKKNDQLLIISDTPPAFVKKWKIFFEDYVEVIKITK